MWILFLAYGSLVIILAAAAVIDLNMHRIPDRLSLACLAAGLAAAVADRDLTAANSFWGCILCGGTLLFFALITKEGIGLGDAKLFAAAGVGLGAGKAAAALMLSAILCGLLGLVLLTADMRNRKRTIPFAPFILVSVVIVLTTYP